MNKKVLIIAYYWPPAGGGGVQRWVKFVKYLKMSGFEPHVYVPENPSYPLFDATLMSELPADLITVKKKISEPYEFYRKFIGASHSDKTNAGFISEQDTKTSLNKKIANWIRGNFFIPDARMLWIKPSIRFLRKYIRENDIPCIITTGPPQSLHLIGLGLRDKLDVKWIADFRDPWVNMDNREEMMLGKRALNKHIKLEREVLTRADEVITVSWYLSGQYEKLSGRKIHTITNGFDTTDFQENKGANYQHFTIGHYGTLGADRNSVKLWKALAELCRKNPAFAEKLNLELVGPVDVKVKKSIEEAGLTGNTSYIDYLPHLEIIDKLYHAAVLLVITNQNANEEGRVTGKIFEYVAAHRPVLGIGSVTSDCARVINETNSGRMCAHEDQESMMKFLEEQFNRFQNGAVELATDKTEQFTRKALTTELINLIEK